MAYPKPLVLEAGRPHLAGDFERYEFAKSILTGSKCELILHLSNGTTIVVPSEKQPLIDLIRLLAEAFPVHCREYYEARWGKG